MKKILLLFAMAMAICVNVNAQTTTLWESDEAEGVLVDWGAPCHTMSAEDVKSNLQPGGIIVITVSGVTEGGWPQVAINKATGGWPVLKNEGVGGKTYPCTVDFPITYDVWDAISMEGLMVNGNGAYVSKVEYKTGGEISRNTVWCGDKECNWGNGVGIPASVFADVKPGDQLKIWTSTESCQVLLGGWSGLNLAVYSAGGIDNMTYEDGVATITMVEGYATTNAYLTPTEQDPDKTTDYNVFELLKANGVTMHGPTTITRVDFVPAPSEYSVWNGEKECGWGNGLSIPASVFTNVKAGDQLKVWTSAAGCQIILGGWSGLNLAVYSAGGIDNMTYEDGVATITMVEGYATTNAYPTPTEQDPDKTTDFNVFELLKANGVVIQGQTVITRVDFIPAPDAPEPEPITLAELAAMTAPKVDLGEEAVSVKVALHGAKVTAALDMDDFYLAFIEDETAAVHIMIEGAEVGKTLTGTLTGQWADFGEGMFGATLMVEESDITATSDVDVTTGFAVTDLTYLADPNNANRLVTVTSTEENPIEGEGDQAMVGETIIYDLFLTLGYNYEFPAKIESVTGILVPSMGKLLIVPRSADDIVAAEVPTQTLTLADLAEIEVVPGNPVEATVELNGATVTHASDGEAFIEEEDGGAFAVIYEDELLTRGEVITGVINGELVNYGNGMTFLMLSSIDANATVVTTNVATGKELSSVTGIGEYANRLVTITATDDMKIAMTEDDDQNESIEFGGISVDFRNIHEDLADLKKDKNDNDALPVFSRITGIVVVTNLGGIGGLDEIDDPMMPQQTAMVQIMPRDINDLVVDEKATAIRNAATEAASSSAAVYNLAGQKVSSAFKGIVIKNGKKAVVK